VNDHDRTIAATGAGETCGQRQINGVLICLTIFCLLFAAGEAKAIDGYPGSTWGIITDSSSNLSGSGGMGWVNQGIDWTTLPGGVELNTFAEYRFRDRSRQPQYYDAQGPAVGLELKKYFLRLGVDYYWEYLPDYPGGARRSSNRELYLADYYGWDLAKTTGLRIPGAIGLPGGLWFNLSHNIHGLTGSGGMGWVNQGIDWFTLPGGFVFATYAEYRYRTRTKLEDFYDARGPAVGLEFKKPLFRLGADYYRQHDPALKDPLLEKRSKGLELYATWYVDWDLRKK
jgi:hypothetical protein